MSEAFRKFDLSGRTAFVTGGGTGLGYYMSRGLARSGAKVMIAARREHVLKEASERLTEESFGNAFLYTQVDLADRQSVRHAAEHAISTLNGVDIFIGNAAFDINTPVDGVEDQMVDPMVQVNLAANMALTKAYLPGMRRKKWGRILFCSSTNSIRATAQEGMALYASVKGALNAYTRVVASEVGHDGITANSLVLGMFMTELVQTQLLDTFDKLYGPGSGEAYIKDFVTNTALGRLGEADEVEGLTQLLASDAGAYITGTDLAIDGGLSIMMKPKLHQ